MDCLEIFTGAGGLALGFARAGFNHAQFVEFNGHACRTLRSNFDHDAVCESDIRRVDFTGLSGIRVVAGGPPCQPFSTGGKHLADKDERDMFPQAIRAIRETRPDCFVFENVKGLLRTTFSDYFEYILLRLSHPESEPFGEEDWSQHLRRLREAKLDRADQVDYHVTFRLINAADYGVPQSRERVLIIGMRNDIGALSEFPKPTHSLDRLLWEQQITGEYWRRHGVNPKEIAKATAQIGDHRKRLMTTYGMFEPEGRPYLTIRDAICDLGPPEGIQSSSDHAFKPGARSYAGHTGSIYDLPAKTIKAGGHGVPGGENMIRFPDESIRYLTIREAKVLQTFPVDFSIAGGWGEAMRQIGNAVPVAIGELIARQLRARLEEAHLVATVA
jgi:DNA (cytosine-5)-methyltransferase 1